MTSYSIGMCLLYQRAVLTVQVAPSMVVTVRSHVPAAWMLNLIIATVQRCQPNHAHS